MEYAALARVPAQVLLAKVQEIGGELGDQHNPVWIQHRYSMHVGATYPLRLAHVGIPSRWEHAVKQHGPREALVPDLGCGPAKYAGSDHVDAGFVPWPLPAPARRRDEVVKRWRPAVQGSDGTARDRPRGRAAGRSGCSRRVPSCYKMGVR